MDIAESFNNGVAAARHFALWGPAFCSSMAIIVLLVFDKPKNDSSIIFWALIAAFSFYTLAIIPAGLAGFFIGFFRPSSLAAGVGLSAVTGAVIMLASLFIAERIDGRGLTLDVGTLGFIALGAVAAAGTGFIFFWRTLR